MDTQRIHQTFLSPENFEALLGTVDSKYRSLTGGAALPTTYRSLGLHLMKEALRLTPVYRPESHTPVEYLKMLNRRVLELFLKQMSSDMRGEAGSQRAMQRDQSIPPRKVAHFDSGMDPRASGLYRKADESNELERRFEETVRTRGSSLVGSRPPARVASALRAQEVRAEDPNTILRRLEEETAERGGRSRPSVLHDTMLDDVLESGAEDTPLATESWEEAFEAMRKEETAGTLFRPEDRALVDTFRACLEALQKVPLTPPVVSPAPAMPVATSLDRDVHLIDSSQRNPMESTGVWDLTLHFPPAWKGCSTRFVRGWIPRVPALQDAPVVRVHFTGGSILCAASSAGVGGYVEVTPLQSPPILDGAREQRHRVRVSLPDGTDLPPYPDLYVVEAITRNPTEAQDRWILRTKTHLSPDMLGATSLRIWGNHAEPSLPVQQSVPVIRVQAPTELEVRLPTPGDQTYDIKRAGSLILGLRPVLWLFEKLDEPVQAS